MGEVKYRNKKDSCVHATLVAGGGGGQGPGWKFCFVAVPYGISDFQLFSDPFHTVLKNNGFQFIIFALHGSRPYGSCVPRSSCLRFSGITIFSFQFQYTIGSRPYGSAIHLFRPLFPDSRLCGSQE
jgi:hypothetical protein